MERQLHDTIIALRCHPAVASAAAHEEADYSARQRNLPLLSNERVLFKAGSTDLMHVYMCDPLATPSVDAIPGRMPCVFREC
jgi:hypothetical protein